MFYNFFLTFNFNWIRAESCVIWRFLIEFMHLLMHNRDSYMNPAFFRLFIEESFRIRGWYTSTYYFTIRLRKLIISVFNGHFNGMLRLNCRLCKPSNYLFICKLLIMPLLHSCWEFNNQQVSRVRATCIAIVCTKGCLR